MMVEERYKQPFVDEICRFVRIPSRSSQQGGEEGTLQALIAERMRQIGAAVRTFEPDDIVENRGSNRLLLLRIRLW